MTINLQVKLNSTDITDKVVSYTREKHICTSVGLIDLVVLEDSLSPRVWDTIELYEEGVKRGTYFVYTVSRVEANGSIEIQAQDASKKLADYFITDQYLVDYLSYSKYWITKFLDEINISHEYNVSGNGTPLSNNTNLGINTTYDTVMTLLQQSGWYMYFDANNHATIGKLSTKSNSGDIVVDDSNIISLNVNDHDSMLRNRAVVWGAGNPNDSTWVFADISVNTPYNVSTKDKRAVVLANSNIPNIAEATKVANQMIKEFARISDEITLEVAGYLDVEVGDTVHIKSKYRNGLAMLTSVGCTVSSNGVITTLVLNERCPRLFAYYFVGTGPGGDAKVYIGTENDGIWYKDINGATWSGFNDGLTSMYVRDLAIQNGIFGTVVGNDFCYRQLGDTAWNRFTISGLYDAGGVYHTFGSVHAVAVAMDKTDSTMHVGFNTNTDPRRAWILDITASGTLDASYPIYTGLIDPSGVVISGTLKQQIIDLDNAGAYDIACVTISGLLVPEVGTDGDWGSWNVTPRWTPPGVLSSVGPGALMSGVYTHLASTDIWTNETIWADNERIIQAVDDPGVPFIWYNGPDDIGRYEYIDQSAGTEELKRYERYYRPDPDDFYDWKTYTYQREHLEDAHTGTYVWDAGAGNDLNNTLTRTVDLTGASTASLDCWVWYDLEENVDYGYIQVSTNGGGSWIDIVTPLTGFNGITTGTWENLVISLTTYVGSPILLRFMQTTDVSYNAIGFFVDDIIISTNSGTIFSDGAETLDPDWIVVGWLRSSGILDPTAKTITITPALEGYGSYLKALYKIDDLHYTAVTTDFQSTSVSPPIWWHEITIDPVTWTADNVATQVYDGRSVSSPDFIVSMVNQYDPTNSYAFSGKTFFYQYRIDHKVSEVGWVQTWEWTHYFVTVNLVTGECVEHILGPETMHYNFLPLAGWVKDSDFFYVPIRVGNDKIVTARYWYYPGDGNSHRNRFFIDLVDANDSSMYSADGGGKWHAPPDIPLTGWDFNWSPTSIGAVGNFISYYTHDTHGLLEFVSHIDYDAYDPNTDTTYPYEVWIYQRVQTNGAIIEDKYMVRGFGYAYIIPYWFESDVLGDWFPTAPANSEEGQVMNVQRVSSADMEGIGYTWELRDGGMNFVCYINEPTSPWTSVTHWFVQQDSIDNTIYGNFYGTYYSIGAIDYTGNIVKPPGTFYAGSPTDGIAVALFGDSYITHYDAGIGGVSQVRLYTVKKQTFEYGKAAEKHILRRDGFTYTSIYRPLGLPKVEISQKVPPTVLFTPSFGGPNFPIVSQTNTLGSFYYNSTEPFYPLLDARTFYLSDYPTFITMSGVVASGSFTSPLFIATVGDDNLVHIIDGNVIGPFGTLATLSGNLTHIETTNVDDPPYFFVSAPGAFYQRNTDSASWLNYSATLPSSAITTIRTDDAI